ncbi:MAG: DUF1573 domain-containing protein [Patescibacteria group bacterium]|nr:DUF1573 domain-containing protein [Patescibacteria group bacterium]
MKKIDPIIMGVIIIIFILFGGIIIAANYSSKPKIPTYNATDIERPKMEISEKYFDFGKIKLSDSQIKEITVKNIGTKPLNLSNFTTSCGCTTIQIIYENEKSLEFSLHNKLIWQKDIAPNATAKILIKYNPKEMPVEGEVKRTAYFKTNDPDNTDVQINFSVFVEK